MKTEDLIRGLAADAKPEPGLGTGLALALLVGLAGSVLLFVLLLAPRSHLAVLLLDPRVLLKFAVALSLAAAAGIVVLRLSRPGADAWRAAWALLVPIAFLAVGVLAEMASTPEESWLPGLIGHTALYCVSLIPVMAAPILGAALLALRRGAPSHPTLAGAAAGLLAGGLGVGLYALHCIDDSPFFVLVWYSAAVAIVTAAGALIGKRTLAW